MKSTQRWTGWVWYRGAPYGGFQRQPHEPTVQSTLEGLLSQAGAGPEVSVLGAGRTDKGVSARMQVVAFRAPLDWAPPSRLEAADLGVLMLRRAPRGFHPQWSATGKSYVYRLRDWMLADEPRLEGRTLRVDALQALLASIVGTRDFGAFHPSSSPRRPRTVGQVQLSPSLDITVSGDGFARHQVRYLVGTAVAVAMGALETRDWHAALEQATPIAGLRAPARGLTLWEVHYPEGLDPFTAAERARPPGLPADWANY